MGGIQLYHYPTEPSKPFGLLDSYGSPSTTFVRCRVPRAWIGNNRRGTRITPSCAPSIRVITTGGTCGASALPDWLWIARSAVSTAAAVNDLQGNPQGSLDLFPACPPPAVAPGSLAAFGGASSQLQAPTGADLPSYWLATADSGASDDT